MRRIGIVASGASETGARVVLNEGEEKAVKVEDLVLIKNRNGNDVFAVCRGGVGSNDNLKTGAYSPGVAYARMGRKPSHAKEFFEFKLSVIGDTTTGLTQNKRIIAPCSDVWVFEEKDNPMEHLGPSSITIGYYKEHPNWSVPVNPKFIPYHIGVFSVTGGGKSFLARYELIPLLRKAEYDVLIFDWKGSDYVPYFDKVINFSDIALDEDVVVSYLTSKMDHFGYSGEYKHRNAITETLEDVIYETKWREASLNELKGFLQKNVIGILRSEHLDRTGNIDSYGRRYIRKFRKALRKIDEGDLENILGHLTPENILNIAREAHVVVIDISQTGKDEKLSIFLAIAKYLRELMEKKERLNLALLIDEGPQYCVAGDTLVQLGDGRLEKIEDVVKSRYVGHIASANRFLKISHDRIVEHFKIIDDRLKIVTAKGKNTIVVSPDTRLLWMNPEGEPEWIEASKLREGDYIAYARRMPNPNGERGQLPPEDLVYLAGLVASDGCLSLSKYRYRDHYNYGYYIFFTNKEKALHEKFCSIVEKLTGRAPHTRQKGTRSYESRIGNKWLFEKLQELGIPIGKKHGLDVPARVATLPNHLLKEYLRGIFDGDGSISTTKCRVMFSTGDREYANKIKHLLLRFGTSSLISTSKGYSYSRKVKTDTEIFNVVMWGADARKFIEEIGFSHPEKARKADNILCRTWSKYNHSHSDTIPHQGRKVKGLRLKAGIARIPFGIENTREQNKCAMGRLTLAEKVKKLRAAGLSEGDVESLNRLVASDLKWLKVSKVEQLPKGPLYDLTINESSNFVANGFVVHNCPFKPRGLEYDTTEMLSQLCALGRSYNLSVILLSQGIAGEIGINASIRRNLNTQFIGKIHPLDIAEASQLLSALDLDPNFLVSLPEGHFYFLGNMNPSPIPLLITFSINKESEHQ